MFNCIKCQQQVSRRKSLAVIPGSRKEDDKFVIFRDKNGIPVTRKPLPRQHRGKCPE